MSFEEKTAFDLDDLPLDVFELADAGAEVESLTAGHGMAGMAGSRDGTKLSCSCSTSS